MSFFSLIFKKLLCWIDTVITQFELKKLLNYDPETGEFTWINPISNRVKPCSKAGCLTRGYIAIKVNKRMYRAHRLAWLYMTGNWPTLFIDHINGIRNDNRFCNLREADQAGNQQNITRCKSNKKTSRLLGVTLSKGKYWVASIGINGKQTYLGTFDTEAEAHKAYINSKRLNHELNTI